MKTLYLTGRLINYNKSAWEFMGIFEEEKKAVKNCINREDFVAPVELNKGSSQEKREFPGCYYPNDKKTSFV